MRKVAIAGAGGRAYHTYAKTLADNYSDVVQLVGVYDRNPIRAAFYEKTVTPAMKAYDSFDGMLADARPDLVIVTTVDGTHHEYVTRALMSGCDVVCEKPLAISVQQCRDIAAAERVSGHRLQVTFNCRFMPYIVYIKELLNDGAVGKILSINYEYLLGLPHGSDYFRRWHRRIENSGSLLVHKSTHHFDIANWLISDEPSQVSALGSLHYFGSNRNMNGKRCRGCACCRECEFYTDFFTNPLDRELYLNAESADGYLRDGCPFDPEINIYDNHSVSVRYKRGGLLTYALTTYNPYEGYRINITGTKGRMEARELFTGEGADDPQYHVRLMDTTGKLHHLSCPKAGGTHSGGDERMIRMLFGGDTDTEDTLGQCAGSRDGIASALIGICARESIQTGSTVNIGGLLDDIFTKCSCLTR